MSPPKIKIPLDYNDGVEIINSGKGNWELTAINYSYCFALLGWGGEQQLTIFTVPRQDGNTHILVVHSQCDAESTTQDAIVNSEMESNTVNVLIDSLLRRVECE